MDEKTFWKLSDAALQRLYGQAQAATQAARVRSMAAEPASAGVYIPERIEVLVAFSGAIADLEGAGLESAIAIRGADGISIGEGRIAPACIDQLAAIPHVLSVESRPEMRTLLDHSTKDVRVDVLRNIDPNATGEGVVIAIIDDGVDWTHASFRRQETRQDQTIVQVSRFLAIWSPSAKLVTSQDRPGPSGLGVVYSKNEIERALRRERTLITSPDRAHGTHVAGIAAGDPVSFDPAASDPSGIPRVRSIYQGIAPKSEILFIERGPTLISALEFIRREVGSRPVVVNFSQGASGHSGGRDGTHKYEKAINAFVDSGPGRVVVVAAGNFGDDKRHYQNVVRAGSFLEVEFRIYSTGIFHEKNPSTGEIEAVSKPTPDTESRSLDFWYPNGHQLNLQVIAPNDLTSKLIPHRTHNYNFVMDEAKPDAPPLLTGSPGNRQVVLSWDAADGASQYEVFRRTGSSGTLQRIKTGLTATTYTDNDTGLINGTSYSYIVRAKNEEGESEDSNDVSVTPGEAPFAPPPPTNLTAIPGTGRMILAWDASHGATSYEVHRATGFPGTFTPVATLLEATTYIDEQLSSITYGYAVKAKNAVGASSLSSPAYIAPLGFPPPAPASLNFIQDDRQLLVRWTKVNDAELYEVRRSIGNTENFTTIGVVEMPNTTFLDTGLANNTSYYYAVRARNRWGLGPDSPSSGPVTPAEPSAAPPVPEDFRAENEVPGNTIVRLSWKAAARATAYEIHRAEGAAGQLLPLVALTDSIFDRNEAGPGVYRYAVRARNSRFGWTELTEERSVTIQKHAPEDLTAAAGNGQVVLHWKKMTDADSYEIYRRRADTEDFQLIEQQEKGTTYTDSAVDNDTSYRYQVKAKATNRWGTSLAATTPSVTPRAAPMIPPKPIDLGVKRLTKNEVELTWRASPGATVYIVKRKDLALMSDYKEIGTTSTPSYKDDAKRLRPGRTYQYVVYARNATGQGDLSPSRAVDVTIPPSDRTVNVSIAMRTNHADNNDHNFNVTISNVKRGLKDGVWKIRFINPANVDVPDLHGWILADNDAPGRTKKPTFLSPTAATTLSIPAAARGAISVASYVGEGSGADITPSAKKKIHKRSSLGPARVTAAEPNQAPKPDLAAPGVGITSSKADTGTLPGTAWNNSVVDVSGTSQAAPHVTGAIALMLERDKTLTKSDIVGYLRDTVVQVDGQPPPREGGIGLLDVNAAVQRVPDRRGQGTKAVPADSLGGSTSTSDTSVAAMARGAGPMAAPFYAEVLFARARAIPDGELCAAIISRHFSEVRRLINTNKRIATLWYRGDGSMLLQRLLAGSVDASVPAPILGEEQRNYLRLFLERLNHYGSPSLRASIERYGETMMRLLESPLAAQVTSQPNQVTT